MSRDELERAREHVFIAGVGDGGVRICAANVPYGLAKIHHVQRQLGHPADATFVGAPDCTVTRNRNRWNQGFGYGGAYQWTGEFTVLDLKPNACGMLTGALPSFPELDDVRARLHDIDRDGLTLDGVRLDNDLTESNHFVDVFEYGEAGSKEPPPGGARFYFIMHSSGHEHRTAASPLGPGLYYDESDELLAMARTFETPWGVLRILEGDAAARYQDFYLRVQDFNHRRRETLAKALFGDFDVVVNATHQGLTRGYNRANIGVYTYDDPTDGPGPLFPLTLSPTLPAFLVRGRRNISDDAIEQLGWRARLERLGMVERVRGTNLLPHGGGYSYDNVVGVVRVIEDGPDQRRFEIETSDGAAPAVRDPRELAYGYRGLEVKQRMEQLGLGEAVVQLELKYVLTA